MYMWSNIEKRKIIDDDVFFFILGKLKHLSSVIALRLSNLMDLIAALNKMKIKYVAFSVNTTALKCVMLILNLEFKTHNFITNCIIESH